MNSAEDLETLLAITQIKYDQQQQSFQKLVSEENRLRKELARLDDAARQTQSEPIGILEMRAIGADIIWQSWVTRKKADLNIKLAQVLSVKLHHQAQIKTAYGKVLVVTELLDSARKELRQKAARRVLEGAVDQTLFITSNIERF